MFGFGSDVARYLFMQRVLVVDDDPIVARIVRRALERHGYDVTCAETGHDALGHIATGEYELAIIDYLLPDISGLGLMMAIRRREKEARGRRAFLVLSSARIVDDWLWAEAGADACLPKPFSVSDLLAALTKVAAQPLRLVAANDFTKDERR